MRRVFLIVAMVWALSLAAAGRAQEASSLTYLLLADTFASVGSAESANYRLVASTIGEEAGLAFGPRGLAGVGFIFATTFEPEPLRITYVRIRAGNIEFGWAGGFAPGQVQRAGAVSGKWEDVPTEGGVMAYAAPLAEGGYYRVAVK